MSAMPVLLRAMRSFFGEVGALRHIVGMLARIVVDSWMSSRISFKSFVVNFCGMLLHEGCTASRITAEEVAADCLGSGNSTALSGRVAIITGASGGLGMEHARVLMKYGCHVVFAVRNVGKAQALVDSLLKREPLSGKATVLQLDLDDLATVRPFVEAFQKLELPLNYLVNNAGVMTPKEFRASRQGFETQFATNHLAHFLLTELLLPVLRATRRQGGDARVIILSSVGSTLCKSVELDQCIPPQRETYNGPAEYGISKALNLLHCRGLQQRCARDGILCCAVHPGVIKTGLTREGNADSTVLYDSALFRWMHKDVPQGAATQVYCTLSEAVPAEIAKGTCFWYNGRPQQPLGIAAPGVRDDLVDKVWSVSEALVEPFL